MICCPICSNETIVCCCMTLKFDIPLKTVSEANSREHWIKKSARHKLQRNAVAAIIKPHVYKISVPCKIKLIRISPRKLDLGDNLPMAFKSIKDQLGEMICNEKVKGRGDGDDRILWEYNQERGKPKEYAVRIEISF